MKKKLLFVLLFLAVFPCALIACSNNNDVHTPSETVYAYCSDYYNAGLGNFGSFSIAPSEVGELETNFDDLSKFSLGGAFDGMTVQNAVISENDYAVVFYVKGELKEGDFGTVSGEGIIKGKSVEVNVPIAQATADSKSVIYGNASEQQIEIDLMSACFNKSPTVDDFVLRGAARTMTVKSVTTDYVIDEDDEILSQTATLTLTGEPDGTDYAYIEISSNATTYNKPLNVTLPTDFYGAYILNDHIDTFMLKETVYIQANNLSFCNGIDKADITFNGALENYAVLESIDFVNGSLIGLHLSFPYTYLDVSENLGYIKFDSRSNEEQIAFTCSSVVAAPAINFTLNQTENTVKMILVLEHEEFNLLDSYPFTVYDQDGDEIIVSELAIVNLDDYLSITFDLPDNRSGLMYFELKNAYDIINTDGEIENVTVKTAFYI